ncbi:hypothetical protein BDV23DRAFT_184319 [Aspergillus alliaceus]|uniref:Uncharacterized protein n=1 Tax=Petromyces alliaceus TaxID=209559 RepID=A0A5N7C619_PETAA|nr:hypothetical protein BDV23DRAFT_184319 [Aspergillus alliaceus]
MSLGTWLRVFRLSSANQLQSLFKTENPLLPVLVEYGNRWKVKNDRRGFIGEDGEFKSGTAIPNVDMSNDTTKNFLPLVTLWYNARIEPLTGRWVRMGGILIGVKLKLDIEDTGTDPAEHRRKIYILYQDRTVTTYLQYMHFEKATAQIAVAMRPELEPIIDALRESYCTKRVDDLSRDVTDTAATEAFALGTNTELTAYTTPETVCKLPNRNRSTNEPESADLSKTPGIKALDQ